MVDSPTLSKAPPEHPALDYAFLRSEGIRHLENLAGHVWSDFNTHDPGITILEQLCYALTDLAYRASHAVPDLLATSGEDPYSSLYSAATILTSEPVTLLDLRKLVIDVAGVKNAWVELVLESKPALHFHAAKGELRFQTDPPYTAPVGVRGLVRVLIETSDVLDRSTVEVQREAARRLHASRPLCSDFDEIQVLAPQPIQVLAEVEIGPVDDAERVLLDIYERLSEYISPTPPFLTLTEMLAAHERSDKIFEGPRLEHGFLRSEALERSGRREAIHTSDLIREMMSVAGVRAVRHIAVSAGSDEREPWNLALDRSRAPRLDLQGSSIQLMKGRLSAGLEATRIVAALSERRRRVAARASLSPTDRDFVPDLGRDRHVAHYRSIQHDLPAIYGVGSAGLPATASPQRRAQAKQLKAYLLFFDQLLASYHAQLAHAGSLLSFNDQDTRTYFTQMVEDPSLDLASVRRQDGESHQRRLSEIAEDAGVGASLSNRKNRFYNHLLARFAEQFNDYSLVTFGSQTSAEQVTERLVADKRSFLQRYPRISSARGTGRDLLSSDPLGSLSGLEERLARKLGLTDAERPQLVEHVLLAPTIEDNVPSGKLDYQPISILSNVLGRDPYSLQLSFVFASGRGRTQQAAGSVNELRLLVEHTVREETPAHLTPYVHWLDEAEWAAFEHAHADWLDAHRDYRAEKLGLVPITDPRCIRMRDARDRLIDLLGFGQTFPLRDLPIRDDGLTVPFNQVAHIPIGASQRGVVYELCDDRDTVLTSAEGTGETLLLVTPAMLEDATYSIVARKLASGRRAHLLRQATVKVGLDVTLPARILAAELLIPSDHPSDADARIVDWGATIRIQVDHGQEGVDYHLVQVATTGERRLSADVRGNLGDIVLIADAADEDVDIRIRATKVFDPSEHRPTQTALLDAVLPARVRARLDLKLTVDPLPISAFGGNLSIVIETTQPSAAYTLFVRSVSDRDYVFGSTDPKLLSVAVEGAPTVYVQAPGKRVPGTNVDGFVAAGAALPGTGASLRLPASSLREDSVIVVRARKEHRSDSGNGSSEVQLSQAALVLTQPNPKPGLRLAVVMAGAQTTGTLEISGGQAGVFYSVRSSPGGADLGLPAYFHKTDAVDATLNKGIDQLRLQVDFAVSRGTLMPATTSTQLGTTPPLAPSIATGPLAAGATLYVRAIKAQTRVATDLSESAVLTPLPEIAADPPIVPKGTPATISVRSSVAGDQYQLTLDGQAVEPARTGNGSDLKFTSAALDAPAEFVMRVTRPGAKGLVVERRVVIVVGVGVA